MYLSPFALPFLFLPLLPPSLSLLRPVLPFYLTLPPFLSFNNFPHYLDFPPSLHLSSLTFLYFATFPSVSFSSLVTFLLSFLFFPFTSSTEMFLSIYITSFLPVFTKCALPIYMTSFLPFSAKSSYQHSQLHSLY